MSAEPNAHDAVIAGIRARVDAWRGFPLGRASEAWPDARPIYEPRAAGDKPISATTDTLLRHWFRPGAHELGRSPAIQRFRYWPHQRRLVETFIYLYEGCGVRRAEEIWRVGGVEEAPFRQKDPWTKLGGQLATGSGKTKMMSLLIAWSYLNAVLEGEDHLGLGRHVLLIAPGLFVKDRLLSDFLPPDGRASVFRSDPVVPREFDGAWNLQVYGPDTCPRSLDPDEGALIVTNYHQLLREEDEPEPDVAPGRQARLLFEGGEPKRLEQVATPLLSRFGRSQGLLVLNDEAHHVWDEPGHQDYEKQAEARRKVNKEEAREAMAWIGALRSLDGRHRRMGLQIDLSATLFQETGADTMGTETVFRKAPLFRHTAVDYPLSEAITDGIVKLPLLEKVRATSKEGEPEELVREGQPDAWRKYELLLVAGIKRWIAVRDQLRVEGDARKPLLFILCDDRHDAREVANFLTYGKAVRDDLTGHATPTGWIDPASGERLFVDESADGARSTVIEIHVGRKEQQNEAEWDKVRQAVNAVDANEIVTKDETGAMVVVPNPYNVVVSVMMLKEGWDVRNVKVIVPLRSCHSRTLTMQTLGRGLRKMNAPEIREDGSIALVPENLYVMQHPSFESALNDIGDLVKVIGEDEPPEQPQYVPIFPREPASARLAVDVRMVRFEGTRRRVEGWRASFDVRKLPPPSVRFDWRESFSDTEIQTFLVEAGTAIEAEGLTFTLEAVPSYRDYDHVIEAAYVMPLLAEIQAAHAQRGEVKAVVKDYLETRSFKLLAGQRLSFDRMVADGEEGGRLTIGNLLRGDVIRGVKEALRGALKTAIHGVESDEQAILHEELASALAPYQAVKRHVFERPNHTVFERTALENDDELKCAMLLDRADDVVGWLYNHRSGVGYSIEYDWRGYLCHYYPDFLARARFGATSHNFIVEVKGKMEPRDDVKAAAARRVAGLLSRYAGEPWHYLLIIENITMARDDLSWWERQSVTSIGHLLRHQESLNGADLSAWRYLTADEVRARLIELAESDGGLSYDRLLAMGPDGEVEADRAFALAEAMATAARPTLRRVFRDLRTGAIVPDAQIAQILSASHVGGEAEDGLWRRRFAELQVSYVSARGPR